VICAFFALCAINARRSNNARQNFFQRALKYRIQ
jgi:hypothetical protein